MPAANSCRGASGVTLGGGGAGLDSVAVAGSVAGPGKAVAGLGGVTLVGLMVAAAVAGGSVAEGLMLDSAVGWAVGAGGLVQDGLGVRGTTGTAKAATPATRARICRCQYGRFMWARVSLERW